MALWVPGDNTKVTFIVDISLVIAFPSMHRTEMRSVEIFELLMCDVT